MPTRFRARHTSDGGRSPAGHDPKAPSRGATLYGSGAQSGDGGVVAQTLSSVRNCSSATNPEPPFSSLLKALRFCRGYTAELISGLEAGRTVGGCRPPQPTLCTPPQGRSSRAALLLWRPSPECPPGAVQGDRQRLFAVLADRRQLDLVDQGAHDLCRLGLALLISGRCAQVGHPLAVGDRPCWGASPLSRPRPAASCAPAPPCGPRAPPSGP